MTYVILGIGIVILLIVLLLIDYMLGRKKHVATSSQRVYPVRHNQELEIFAHGKELFADIFKEIQEAKQQINILFYIAKNDPISNEFYSLLMAKAQEGVEVRFLIDWLSSFYIPRKTIKDLQKANVQFAKSFTPTFPYLFYHLNVRNHRKIAVIDEKVGYVGGFNVGKEYIDQDPKLSPWRDYHLKIVGDAVVDLQQEFLRDWRLATAAKSGDSEQVSEDTGAAAYTIRKNGIVVSHPQKNALVSNTDYKMETGTLAGAGILENETVDGDGSLEKNNSAVPKAAADGRMPLRMVSSDGNSLEDTFAERIREAKASIFIGTPYFIPSKRLLNELLGAAKRGVKITVLVPKKSDHILVKEASLPYLKKLLTAGATIYQFLNGFYHAKVFLFDEEICDIGTSNFDQRSLFLNQEINCFIYDRQIIERVKDVVAIDLQDSQQLTLAEFNNLGLWTKVKMALAKPILPLL